MIYRNGARVKSTISLQSHAALLHLKW